MESSIERVDGEIERLMQSYNQKIGIYNELLSKKEKETEKLEKSNQKILEVRLKKEIIKEANGNARKNAGDILDSMSTSAIRSVVGEHKRIGTIFDERGSIPIADICVYEKLSDGTEIDTDPLDEEGGGIADIIADSEYIEMGELTKKGGPLFLDEPTKYVSEGYKEASAKFLYNTSHYFNRQVIMSTHDTSIMDASDCTYFIKKIDGCSHVTKLK